MEIKTLSKERSAFAADSKQTPFFKKRLNFALIVIFSLKNVHMPAEVAHYWAAFLLYRKGDSSGDSSRA
ncbi:hypothetical protein NYE59_23200 [Paenibacillus sp. FSL L8-0323]|uniref:hypothetical protein n=1 Tax=Paenibacillus sp. FSL L8-0323 TaxID=2975330 RepID=UPI0030F615EE